MLALVPGVLGGCAFNHGGSTNTQPQQFTTQTTPAAPSVAMVAAFVLIPVVVIGAILAVACRSASATARTGRWVATPTQRGKNVAANG